MSGSERRSVSAQRIVMLALQWFVIAAAVLALAALIAGQAGLLGGTPPADLGVRGGRLKAPSTTPNSVSSQAALWPGHPQQQAAQIAPLAVPAGSAGSGAAALARIKAIVLAMPGGAVLREEPGYLHAGFTTRLMKYTDDAEFWFDPAAGVVQVRSASRLGRKDFGANRARIEHLRSLLAAP